MSAASEWVAQVDDVQAQEPPRFTAVIINQARVAINGNMHLQLMVGTVQNQIEIPPQEALGLATWIAATFGEGTPPTVPVLTELVPSTVPVGPPFTLHIHGTGFTAASVVFANGSQRPTTFLSSTEVGITTTNVLTPMTVTIEVGVGPSGPRSNALSLVYTAA